MQASADQQPLVPLDPKLQRVALIIGYMLIIAGVIYAVNFIWPLLTMIARTLLPFLVGLIFAYLFNPVVTFIQKKFRLGRIAGVLLLYLMLIIILGIFIGIVLPILLSQIRNAYYGATVVIPERIDFVLEELREYDVNLQEEWGEAQTWFAENRDMVWQNLKDTVASPEFRTMMQTGATTGLRAVWDVLGIIGGVLWSLIGSIIFWAFVILINIYLLVDLSKIKGLFQVVIPTKHHRQFFPLMAKMDIAVGGFIRGQLLAAFLVGLATFLGLLALGMKQYALLIGVIAGVANLVPYLGPLFGGISALLYVMFSTSYDGTQERLIYGVLVLALIGSIQFIDGFIVSPRIVGNAAKLHPLAVLLALGFGANFGILGMIVAVPSACIIRVLIKEFYWDERAEAWHKSKGKVPKSKPLEEVAEEESSG